MSSTHPIKVITFDLDDTLWDLKPVMISAEQAVFDWLAKHLPRVTEHFDLNRFNTLKMAVYSDHPELEHQISKVRIVALQQAILASGYDPATAQQMSQRAFDIFIEARHRVQPFDDAEDMLSALHPHYTLGALTNGNADISRLAIGDFFDFAFAAEDLDSSKPAPAHFEAALAETGASAKQLVHIGDHQQHDMLGALDAGCHAIWFNPQQQRWRGHHPQPLTVARLSEIAAALTSIERSLAR